MNTERFNDSNIQGRIELAVSNYSDEGFIKGDEIKQKGIKIKSTISQRQLARIKVSELYQKYKDWYIALEVFRATHPLEASEIDLINENFGE